MAKKRTTRSRSRKVRRSPAPRRRAAAAKARALPPRAEPARQPERPGRRAEPAPMSARSRAFIAEPRDATDELAEELGESFVLSATSGEDPEEHYERERPEEEGGPFLETSGKTEFAYGVDESNPEDAEPAPWPTVSFQGRRAYRPGGPR